MEELEKNENFYNYNEKEEKYYEKGFPYISENLDSSQNVTVNLSEGTVTIEVNFQTERDIQVENEKETYFTENNGNHSLYNAKAVKTEDLFEIKETAFSQKMFEYLIFESQKKVNKVSCSTAY